MDEKRPSTTTTTAAAPKRRPRSKAKLAQAGAAALALCWLSFQLVANVVPRCHARRHDGDGGGDGLLSYPGEHIKWTPCGEVRGRRLECSAIDVPMDQFNASNNSGGKTFNVPLVRLRGRNNATRNLVMNPGGPGGSGFALMYGDGPELSELVEERYHILSFDPRGVNSSRPLASCYPDQATREAMRNPNDGEPERESESAHRYAWTTNYVRACADTLGEHGRYVNTPQTAADMNSILDAVGQRDMVYWGLSYGSVLGQTYAQMFPERSSRVVIDGVADVFDWYGAPLLLADYTDSQRVLDGFFDECVKAGPDKCALARLVPSSSSSSSSSSQAPPGGGAGSGSGSDSRAPPARQLQAKVMRFLDGLKSDPLPVYVDATTYGVLDHKAMWLSGVWRHMYTPGNWFQLADRLAALMTPGGKGNATGAFLAYGRGEPPAFRPVGEASDVVELNDGAVGPAHLPHGREALNAILFPFYRTHAFALSHNRINHVRQQWTLPRTHAFRPRNGTRTAHPLLVLSTTYDPVCPLKSARVARAAFQGARLVEVKAYGHCSLAKPSRCAVGHLRAYLADGTLPAEDVRCDVDSGYFERPEGGGQPEKRDAAGLLLEREEDPEARLRAAQSALASSATWGQWRW